MPVISHDIVESKFFFSIMSLYSVLKKRNDVYDNMLNSDKFSYALHSQESTKKC